MSDQQLSDRFWFVWLVTPWPQQLLAGVEGEQLLAGVEGEQDPDCGKPLNRRDSTGSTG